MAPGAVYKQSQEPIKIDWPVIEKSPKQQTDVETIQHEKRYFFNWYTLNFDLLFVLTVIDEFKVLFGFYIRFLIATADSYLPPKKVIDIDD